MRKKSRGEIMEDLIESSNIVEPVGNDEPQIETELVVPTNEPVNAGAGEITPPIVEDKPVQSAEENAKYASIRREAESKAKDKVIADMGMTWNGQPVTTYDQYIKAKAESEQYEKEQKIREEYEAKGLPEELIEELVASKRDRQEREAEKQTKAQQDKQQAEYKEFFDYFKAENGRDFDTAKDIIPNEVWELTNKGKTLADAYAINHTKELKAKIAEYETKLKAQETNNKNAFTSPGNINSNGSNSTDYISSEIFETNKHDTNWVNKNFNKILESRSKW
jgi:hypothetical protein